MAPTVNGVYTSPIITTANPTVSVTATPAASDVLILVSAMSATTNTNVSAVSGLGATWTEIAGGQNYATFWVGTGATASGTITATAASAAAGRSLRVYHLSGVTSDVSLLKYSPTYQPQATPNQIAIGFGYAITSGATGTSLSTKVPATGWTDAAEVEFSTTRRYNTTYAIPTATTSYAVMGDTSYGAVLVVGSPTTNTMVTKRNGVYNSSFETAVTGWGNTGFSGGRTSAQAFTGGGFSYGGTASTTAPLLTSNNTVGYFTVAPGRTVTASGYVYASAARTAGLTLNWRNREGLNLTTTTYSGTDIPANTWTRVTLTATVPANAYFVALAARIDAVAGDLVYFDALQLEDGPTATPYFDGYTTASGVTNVFTGASDVFSAVQVQQVGQPYIKARYSTVGTTAANPAVTVTEPVAAGDVLLLFTTFGSADNAGTAVSGCGATWSKVANTLTTVSEVWIGVGATSTGTVTHTGAADSNGRTLNLYHVSGSTGTVVGAQTSPGSATPASSPVLSAGSGQIVFGTAYTLDSNGGISGLTPSAGWSQVATQTNTANRYWGQVSRIPSATANHSFTASYYMQEVVLGDAAAAGKTIASALASTGTLNSGLVYTKRISSGLSGSGTLASALQRKITSALSGSGTLASALTNYRRINSALSGSGTLSSVLSGGLIHSNFSGSGTLASSLQRNIRSTLSGTGTLGSALVYTKRINSLLSGTGGLTSELGVPVVAGARITSQFVGEGVLYSELGYVVKAAELGATPLGKLASFSVSTAATPLNPAEGASGAPSVTAGYIKGLNPEFVLGETNVLSHGAVGTYEGEVVRLSLPEGSDVASISQDTALTLLNNDLNLFPFIDAAPSTWTAARAIDYWTQQAGLFYDKVPGDCIAYASGYGHTDSYGADTKGRFYEKLTGDPAATQIIGSRSVRTFGSTTSGVTALHEVPKGSVPVSVPRNRKLVASVGVGLRGTGRNSSVTWNMTDAKKASHALMLLFTSEGAITAFLGGVLVASTTVAPNADYRVVFSVERVSNTALVGKLTIHTDDLNGNGALVYASKSVGIPYALPPVLYLDNIAHNAVGGTGTQMIRWGTYLTVAKGHPMELPVVQKAFSQSRRQFGFVSGFNGNVWAKLNEYCAITRQDVSFVDSKLTIIPRISALSVPRGTFSKFSRDSERRDKYKQVAVVNKQSKAVSTNDAILWRADSVFQIAAREVFETTVQTKHSILSVVQPVAVNGIWPFPYKQGGGQYVVTGADGYIIAPQWWYDNGGKVEVSLTGKEGEIAIKITAPQLDTVRAPYRISEGAADRPALYVAGSGVLNDPKEVHVGTGAHNAKEGFDNVFESPFIAGPMETYDTAAAMAAQYSASVADVSFELPNDFYTPSRFGQFPAGARFMDGKQVYRIKDASQSHSRVSGNAVPNTTIADYVASYPPGSTIADEKARHVGRTIKQFNISPLRSSNGQ